MNLNTFCNQYDYREYLRTPFNMGDRTIACNGQTLLSVPRCTSTDLEEITTEIEATVRNLLDNLQTQQFAPLPEITMPEPTDCPACKGTGHAKRTECPECYGEGEAIAETDHNEYEVLCKSCDGDGYILSSVGNSDEEYENCDGSGKVYTRTAHVIIDGLAVSPKHLNLIKDEPGIEVSADAEKYMLYFRAGDQEGVIMGMNV